MSEGLAEGGRGASGVSRPADESNPAPSWRAQPSHVRRSGAVHRGRLWIANQDPASGPGVTIGWVRRYQAADGQLYAVLLSAYVFLTVLPISLVEASYVYADPAALADHASNRLGLTGATAAMFKSVLVGTGEHRLISVLLAILNVALFGLGLGRVLQLVHARSWGIDLRKNAIVDQARYASVLASLAMLTFLFVLQTRLLSSDPWLGWVLDACWLVLLVGYFTWAPYILLHRRVAARDLLPGAVFTVLGLAGLRIVSTLLLVHYLDTYSRTFGALGIAMALMFWIIIAGTVLVLAAALSPTLAHRRDVIRTRFAASKQPDEAIHPGD